MDAVEFLKEERRMCDTFKTCPDCPIRNAGIVCDSIAIDNAEKVVAIVEKWSKENPAQTRQYKFLETFPDAILLDGILNICPADVFEGGCGKYESITDRGCCDCHRRFWLAPIEEKNE